MKVCVFTLGCKVNEVESASLMRGLEDLGYETTDRPEYADFYLINTCAVTAEAEHKSRQAVARLHKYNPAAPVAVFGCAAQNAPSSFVGREGVTFVAGAMRKDRVLSLLGEKGVFCETETAFCELPPPKRTKTRAFLRVQDGCNNFCSYCLIPYLRGRSRSRAAKSVLAEAKALDAKEIVLTGIDLSSYRDGDCDLAGLLRLLRVPARIRLGSLEVGAVTDDFLAAAKEAGNVVPHFHLSLQSGSTAVLRAMHRKYTREEYLGACARIYRAFPDAAITTDIIVGFPTETRADFEDSVSAVREAGFARVHAFPYSPRKGTAAYALPQVPPAEKRERTERMLSVAADAARTYCSRFLGTERVALFEADGGYTDNYIRVLCGAEEGTLARVRLDSLENDGVRAEITEVLS